MKTGHKIMMTSFVFMFVVINAYCQADSAKGFNDNRFIITGGVNLHHNVMGEIGVLYGNILGDNDKFGPLGLKGVRLASEFNTDSKNFILGPKISYEFDLIFLGLRMSIIDYKESNLNDFRFVPEIGLTLIGCIDLFYGVNIPLTHERISAISLSRLSLIININLPGYKALLN